MRTQSPDAMGPDERAFGLCEKSWKPASQRSRLMVTPIPRMWCWLGRSHGNYEEGEPEWEARRIQQPVDSEPPSFPE